MTSCIIFKIKVPLQKFTFKYFELIFKYFVSQSYDTA